MSSFLAASAWGILLLYGACASPAAAPFRKGDGVLVMAHGGSAAWNRQVEEACAPLAARVPLSIAFGMADAETMEKAVRELEARGVERIAVVRLFVSPDSFLGRTLYILGLSEDAPGGGEHAGHEGHHSMATYPISTEARLFVSHRGLLDCDALAAVLLERVRGLSQDPARETVLLLGHGPGEDSENLRWLGRMEELCGPIRSFGSFRGVYARTLREDWPEKRKVSEEEIRAIVSEASRDGGRCLVVPFRVAGFGPYAEVLKGLDYVSDGKGFLPHPVVAEWIERCASEVLGSPASPTFAGFSTR